MWHRYHPHGEIGWSERWISFNGELAHRVDSSNLLCLEGLFVHVGQCDEFIAKFDALLDRIHDGPLRNSVLMSFHGLSLIGDALELTAKLTRHNESIALETSGTSDSLVDEALEIIWTRSHAVISVPEIADQLAVTRRTLDRRFSAATGHSVLDEINTCRLSRAKRLLLETELPIKTVTALAGFSTREQMRLAFRDGEGMSPKQYRASTS